MKASELIYRLARSIERDGDLEVKIAVGIPGELVCCDTKCLDTHSPIDKYKYLELYGEKY